MSIELQVFFVIICIIMMYFSYEIGKERSDFDKVDLFFSLKDLIEAIDPDLNDQKIQKILQKAIRIIKRVSKYITKK